MKLHVSFDLPLRRNPYKGLYIAIEGIDGSGKSTQLHLLAEYFEKKGREVVLTSEPRSDQLTGELIRKILSSEIKIPSNAWQYLYSADRVMSHERHVIPALKLGKIIISHRSLWSIIPYGVLDRLGYLTARRAVNIFDDAVANALFVSQGILSYYHQFITPDITVYLQLSVDEAMRRLAQMDKEKEVYEKKSKLEKIAAGYDWLIKQFPAEFTVINSEQEVEKVTEDIIEKIQNL